MATEDSITTEEKEDRSDMAVLRKAYDRETDPRDRRPPSQRMWEYYSVGATLKDIKRLIDEGMIVLASKYGNITKYRLSEKGRSFVFATTMDREFKKIPAADIIEAMNIVVGFDDLKQAIAQSIENRRRINFLLSGPPACGKSLILEAVRAVVPDSFIVFGSRTSAAGLSDVLFEKRPSILLMDECDKMDHYCFSILLGLMESGEILETKSQKTRGIKLDTPVIAACNNYRKMPQEFLSRFALHAEFPQYARDEFIEVCLGFLTRAENCPENIAILIGEKVFDNGLGDVRKARGVWTFMTEPTTAEVERVIRMMTKYTPLPPSSHRKRKDSPQTARLL
jgi:hypothetical protein